MPAHTDQLGGSAKRQKIELLPAIDRHARLIALGYTEELTHLIYNFETVERYHTLLFPKGFDHDDLATLGRHRGAHRTFQALYDFCDQLRPIFSSKQMIRIGNVMGGYMNLSCALENQGTLTFYGYDGEMMTQLGSGRGGTQALNLAAKYIGDVISRHPHLDRKEVLEKVMEALQPDDRVARISILAGHRMQESQSPVPTQPPAYNPPVEQLQEQQPYGDHQHSFTERVNHPSSSVPDLPQYEYGEPLSPLPFSHLCRTPSPNGYGGSLSPRSFRESSSRR